MLAVLALLLSGPEKSEAYSVMSHQAIVDVVWEPSMKPALRKRFPNASEDEINRCCAWCTSQLWSLFRSSRVGAPPLGGVSRDMLVAGGRRPPMRALNRWKKR